MLKKLSKQFGKVRGLFPSPLPTSGQAFDELFEKISSHYDLPNLPSYKHAIATMIMHLGPTVSHIPRYFFARAIRKAMANEIAYNRIQSIKEEENAKKAKLDATDTITSSEAKDVQGSAGSEVQPRA